MNIIFLVSESGITLIRTPGRDTSPPQYVSFFVSTIESFTVHSAILNAPVPTVTEGSIPNLSPAASVVSLSSIHTGDDDKHAKNPE